MADYDIITYTRPNDAFSINFSDPPYMLVNHDGLGVSEFQRTTVSPPGLHGSYHVDTRMDEKIVTVEFQIHAEGVVERQNARRDLIKLVNPLVGPGILRIDQVNDISYEMVSILAESMPLPTADQIGAGTAHCLVRFASHGVPGIRNPELNELPITQGTGGNFTFPWSFPFVLSQSGYFAREVVNNEGDMLSSVHIEMTGPLINPTFKNETTNETISFTGFTLLAGETMVVDTDPNNIVILKNGADATQYLYDAMFWSLAPGPNTILFDIGGTTVDTEGVMSWYTYYLGA